MFMTDETHSIRGSASAPRSILVRPGVGAAGHVVQRSDLMSHRLVIDQPSLILVEEGRKRIRWSGGECVAQAGEAISLQAGEAVDFANTPGRKGTYRALWICWDPELVANADIGRRMSPHAAVHAGMDDAFRASFYRAFEGMNDAVALPVSVATHRLKELLLWLAERDFSFLPPGPPTIGQKVRRLLSADPSADWSMEQAAHATATSVPTLRRKLAAEGMAFRDLMHDVRMSHALMLLENTDEPVNQVALATGYASPSRFAARFRARFGYLPTDIRRASRNNVRSAPVERT
jgi:AraC-like DNA-binding protein